MDLGFTSEGIITVESTDDALSWNGIDELMYLLYKVGVCVKHKGSNQVYEAFKSSVKRMEDSAYQSMKERYGIKTNDESEIQNHPEIESIKKEEDNIHLFSSHGFSETKIGYIPMEGRYTSDEIHAISDMYELSETVPLIFLRKTDKGRTDVCYLRFDDDKQSLTTFDMRLNFHLLDKTDPRRKPFLNVLKGILKAMHYDDLIKTESKNRLCSPSMVTGIIRLIGLICFVHLTFSYFIK